MNSDVASERSILSICIKNPQKTFEVGEVLDRTDFSKENNRKLFHVISEIALEKKETIIDLPLIESRLTALGYTEGSEQVVDLADACLHNIVDESNLLTYLTNLKSISVKNHLLVTLDKTSKQLSIHKGDLFEHIALVEDNLLSYLNTLDRKEQGAVQISKDIEWIQSATPESVGFSTGFKRFDDLIGMARRNSVNFIGARPKTGKSFFAANLAVNIARGGIPVLITDTELNLREQQKRFLSIISGVPLQYVDNGRWKSDKDMIEKIEKAWEEMQHLPIHYRDVVGKSVYEIINIMRSWLFKVVGVKENGEANDCVLIHDYLKMQSSKDLAGGLAEWQALGLQMADLKNFVAKYNTSMFCFGQLNKEFDVAGADRITWTATSVCILENKLAEELEEHGPKRGNKKIHVKMSRYSAGHDPDDYLCFNHNGPSGKFIEDINRSEITPQDQNSEVIARQIGDE